ncbi:hypothetical protein Zmor_007213 [Zophobas morio]|uniref:Uncharacterized protein n=1 Tax=Zophobas morio TaxID=2755281 RepID=A0AA38ITF4_9CUCU|nr:hypothetical protein Zmor_007213 [Zophobas morio]
MKAVTLFVVLVLVASSSQYDTQVFRDIFDQLPPLNIDTSSILKIMADHSCADQNCLTTGNTVCPYAVFCEMYCQEDQQTVGACLRGSCNCIPLQL